MIELQGVSKRYGGETVVDQLSITVDTGELLVLLGGSGSGKTTTLKMINRLVAPTAGSVRVDGVDVSGIPEHDLRRRIGYVFQEVGLFPHMTVSDNVGITPKLLGWEPARVTRRVDELLSIIELEPSSVRDRWPHELSGGQRQRVGVARALAAGPSILLLDEPFGAVDPPTRRRLQDSLVHIRRHMDLTAVFVTHDMAEALFLGDRIAVLRDGHLIQIGTPRELLADPADDYVTELVGTPQRQADMFAALQTDTET